MTEATRFGLSPQSDFTQILVEARSRWLRPSEVCEILRNYQKFDLTPDPPYKPSGGSLFLFDRKALRYFRKDGHRWRKKKDGKTVREAHEKLKSGSVDVLHCYYAHGEDDDNFQRRSYWLLDGQLEHIVLVHYREVSEGNTLATHHFQDRDPRAHYLFQGVQNSTGGQTSYISFPTTINWSGHASLEMENKDSGADSGSPFHADFTSTVGIITTTSTVIATSVNMSGCSSSLSHLYNLGPIVGQGSSGAFTPSYVPEGRQTNLRDTHLSDLQKLSTDQFDSSQLVTTTLTNDASLPIWRQFLNVNEKNLNVQHFSVGQPEWVADTNRVHSDSYLAASALIKDGLDDKLVASYDTQIHTLAKNGESVTQVLPAEIVGSDDAEDNILIHRAPDDHNSHLEFQRKISIEPCTNLDLENSLKAEGEEIKYEKASSFPCDGNEGIKKLDSFGRWMSKKISKDCEDSLMALDSSSYWNSIDAENNDKEVSSLSRHIQLNTDLLAPSLYQEQLFSILDFSPAWAFSGSETKVLISGIFLGGTRPDSKKWCCMFGEVKVEVEVLTPTVLRCQVPAHTPGRVPLYITCSNRLACSEVQEFEFRENLFINRYILAHGNGDKDEAYFLLRLAKMLTLGVDIKMLTCTADHCRCCGVKVLLLPLISDDELKWQKLEGSSNLISSYGNPRDALVEKLLKGILYEWLICKAHEEGKGPNVLDSTGQGVIHMAAALGYQWAMRPIVAAGVNPSFRDARGKTALHWAAYFGREETVVELVRLGAAPGALEDPTSKFPGGQTAADLASSRGHKGIAGYLAEADLTTHLSSLTVKESVIDNVSAKFAAEKVIETASQGNLSSDGVGFGELSLRGSLAAVRNSAQAAARIQAAFRVHSFRHRQLMTTNEPSPTVPSEALVVSSRSRIQKIGHFSDSLHSAAVKIQQKYRGWKGRKEFLKIRNRIVKIQAHVRGHQVRKHYKKVVWSVGIVEKAILRWRRKGAGLRGFRALRANVDDQSESSKTDEYDYLRLARKQKEANVQKALARVQSMVHHPEAQDQYMRLIASSNKPKLEVGDKMVFQDVNS